MHPSGRSAGTAQHPLYVTTHMHTDGPIPGPHSLLTLTSSAYRAGGVPIGTFTANLRELPGATLHPSALTDWRGRAEDWLWTRRAARPPAQVVTAFVAWLDSLGGRPVLVSSAEEPDHLFAYWYLQRFSGRWPFAGLVPATGTLDRSPPCPLSGCRAAGDDLVREVPAA